jgi:hypothetical protein
VGREGNAVLSEFAQGAKTVLSQLVKYKSKLKATHFAGPVR